MPEIKQDIRAATFIVAANDSVHKNMADYVCDGTNDEVEIQAAIDALPWYGGWIQLSEGKFYVSKQTGKTCAINLAVDTAAGLSNITLRGAGLNATTIILANNQDCNIIEMKTGAFASGWKTVGDMTLDGNKANQASGCGIYFKKVGAGVEYDSKFYNVFVTRCKEDGFHIENGWGVTINNCLAEYCDGIGLYLQGTQCYINGFYSSEHLKSGMYFMVGKLQLFNFCIDEVNEHGIQDYSWDGEMSNGYISNWGDADTNVYSALDLEGTNMRVSNITIVGDGSTNTCFGIRTWNGYNTIIGCGINLCRYGIYFVGNDNVLAYNSIRNCAVYGIYLSANSDSVISGNRISICGTSLSLDNANVIRPLIFGNDWTGCTNNPAYAAATTPRFTDNIDIAGNLWLVDDNEVVLKVSVAHDNQNPAIATIPAGSFVTAEIWVNELFNSDGTDTIAVGYDADPDSIVDETDVSSVGRKAIVYGVEGGYMGTARAIEAYYVAGGSAPTTGHAVVVLRITKSPTP